MATLPKAEARTFFRDVTTLKTLLAVLVGQTLTMATLLPSVVAELGLLELVEFTGHLGMLALYTGLHEMVAQEEDEKQQLAGAGCVAESQSVTKPPGVLPSAFPVSVDDFRRTCRLDAWAYGSGLD